MFVNTLSADDKYSLLNRDNLVQPIQMQLSQKQKIFSRFFCVFSKSTLNFEHFEKRTTLIGHLYPKLRTLKNVVRYMAKKSRFTAPFDREHGKGAQTLSQSERQQRYHIQ